MPATQSSPSLISAVQLTPDEAKLRDQLQATLGEIMAKSHSHRDVAPTEMDALAQTAARLHRSLEARGVCVRHHKYMIENRGMKPDNPHFYRHVHPVEDLLKFIDDPSANNDPEDETLDHDFTFEVFSRRWGHPDTYRMRRTKSGWTVARSEAMRTGRDGRVAGRPGTGLFELLDHDSINYPQALPGYLQWLWEKAAEEGLSHQQVQTELKNLADWVSQVEKNSPTGILHRYK